MTDKPQPGLASVPPYVMQYKEKNVAPARKAYEASPRDVELAKQYDVVLKQYMEMILKSPHPPGGGGTFLDYSEQDFQYMDGTKAEMRWISSERAKLSHLLGN
jgi:hypothetical protein